MSERISIISEPLVFWQAKWREEPVPKSSFCGKQRSSLCPRIPRLRQHLTPHMSRPPILRADQTEGTLPLLPFNEKDQAVKVRTSNKQSSH